MPTYDYYCEKCEKTFEIFQSMNDKKLKKCIDEECNGSVERLLGTGAGIIFKGSGFYETDYRSESYKAGEKADIDKKKSTSGDSKKSKTEKTFYVDAKNLLEEPRRFVLGEYNRGATSFKSDSAPSLLALQ